MPGPSTLQKISQGMLVNSSGIIISRVTGLVRDIVFARFFGTGQALAAFMLAYTVPNMFRSLFGEGALTEAFVPVFNEKLARQGKAAAFLLLSRVLSVVLLALTCLTAVGIGGCLLLRPWLPGPLAQATLLLLPIMFPFVIFICAVGFLTGVLNSFDKFAVPAFAPAVLNLVLIGATIYVCPRLGTTDLDHVTGLAWLVVAAGALEALVFAPVLWRLGYRFRFLPQFRAEPVRAVFRLLVPGLIGAGVYQFAVLINRLMAGWLGADAVTSLYYSERLVYLPIGVFSVALTGACLPVMSRAFAQGRPGEMLEALFYSIRHTLFLSLPCVLGLVILGDRVVNLLLRYGKFDDASFVATMAALPCYALGIPAFAALKILRSGFFSRQDTRTPLKVGVTCLALNLALNLALMFPLRQRGLALATSISASLNCVILAALLYRQLQPDAAKVRALALALGKQLLALGGAGAAMYLLRFKFSLHLGLAPRWDLVASRLAEFLTPAGGGMAAYFILAAVLRSPEMHELSAVVLQKLRRRRATDAAPTDPPPDAAA